MKRYWTYRLRNYLGRQKEITLPPHLFDRIKASAGEHGGIGVANLFVGGVPFCAHGHAWGTEARYYATAWPSQNEPELRPFLSCDHNDHELIWAGVRLNRRIAFDDWRVILNVKRGKDEDYVKLPEVVAVMEEATV